MINQQRKMKYFLYVILLYLVEVVAAFYVWLILIIFIATFINIEYMRSSLPLKEKILTGCGNTTMS